MGRLEVRGLSTPAHASSVPISLGMHVACLAAWESFLEATSVPEDLAVSDPQGRRVAKETRSLAFARERGIYIRAMNG
jgi:hypothetical protein